MGPGLNRHLLGLRPRIGSPGCGRPGAALAALLVAIGLAGCTSLPDASEYRASAALLAPASGEPAAADGRSRFREIFCGVAAREGITDAADPDCERFLWRLADEPEPVTQAVARPVLDPGLHVFVVGGAFSDCFGDASVAWRRAVAELRGPDLSISIVPVSGRSSAEFNARRIAEAFEAPRPDASRHVVLIGYSKGAVDILHFLADFPDLASAVDAVVGVSGPVRGSLAAERGAWVYDTLLAGAFSGRCDPGDGGVVDSLRPEYRQEWLAAHDLPQHIRFYTVSAFTTREHMARALAPTWRLLAASDRRNDGQVTLEEGLLPGSTLLAYANADHWSLAIDIEEELEFFAAREDQRRYPRSVLFESILRYVSRDLGAGGTPTGAGRR